MHPNIDPQLAAGLARFERALPGGIDLEDIPAARKKMDDLRATMATAAPDIPGIASNDRYVSGPGGVPDILVRLYQPEPRPAKLPALLWMHGGGYVLGSVQAADLQARTMARALGCVVASVEYRLAPEHPFPAALDDCYAVLTWLTATASQIGIDHSRIAIGGASAGGGLAAGLALMARDRAEIAVCYQLLLYPMLDDSNVQRPGPDMPDTPVWPRAANLLAWRAYLQQEPGSDGISVYAAPIRARDVSGLPPTFIGVGTADLFRDENIAYAQRLMRAGVPTELHVYADGFHGFDGFASDSDAAQRFTAEHTRILSRSLHG